MTLKVAFHKQHSTQLMASRAFSPTWSVLAAMYALALSVIFCQLTGSMVLVYASAVLAVGTITQYTISSLFYGRMNTLALAASQTVFWYTLPFSYAWLFEYEPYLTNSLTATINAVFVVAIIGAFTFWLSLTWQPQRLPVIPKSQTKDYGVPFLIPFVAFQTVLLATGTWGKDVALDQAAFAEIHTPIVSIFAASITPAIAPTAAYLFGSALISKHGRKSSVYFYVFTLLLQIAWWLPIGRRTMAIALTTAMFAFFGARFERFLTPKRKMTVALGSVGAIGLLYVLWKAFFTFRVATHSIAIEGISTRLSVLDLIQLQSAVASADADLSFADNLLSRPFIINSFAAVRENAIDYLYGIQLLTQAILATPQILLPTKNTMIESLGGTNEDLWTALVRVPWTDHANTIALEGYLDLGILGAVALLVLLCLALRLILQCGQMLGSQPLSIYIFFSVFATILSIENATAAYLNSARSLIMVIGITYVFQILATARR